MAALFVCLYFFTRCYFRKSVRTLVYKYNSVMFSDNYLVGPDLGLILGPRYTTVEMEHDVLSPPAFKEACK